MVDYKTNDPKGWCGDPKRGAALGRSSILGEKEYDGKLHLRRVKIDNGGYDSNGTYFGIGAPLYWCASEDGSIDEVRRAAGRDEAKAFFKGAYPKARFYR